MADRQSYKVTLPNLSRLVWNCPAHYVAEMFVAHDRNVGFGVQPLDSSEPSTLFGRAVRDALEVFKVYKLPQGQHGALKIAHWKMPPNS